VRIFDSGVMLRDPVTFGEHQLSYRTGDIVSPHIQVAEPLYLEMCDFATSIREGTTPRSSAVLGLEVVRVIEAVERSLNAGGRRTEVGGWMLNVAS
jgi:predicted dehydrogenase